MELCVTPIFKGTLSSRSDRAKRDREAIRLEKGRVCVSVLFLIFPLFYIQWPLK